MPLACYTLKILKNETTSNLYVDSFDVITPVYSPTYSSPGSLQSTQNIGSHSVESTRKFGAQVMAGVKPRNWAQAIVDGPPIGAISTSSTVFIPVPKMSCVIDSATGMLQVSLMANVFGSTLGNASDIRLYIDGKPSSLPTFYAATSTTGGYLLCLSQTGIIPVSTGKHLIQMYWKVGGGGTMNVQARSISVVDIG